MNPGSEYDCQEEFDCDRCPIQIDECPAAWAQSLMDRFPEQFREGPEGKELAWIDPTKEEFC